MTKEEKQYLKEHAPWDYEAYYGDPVTGQTESDTTGVGVFIIVVLALLGFGLYGLIFG